LELVPAVEAREIEDDAWEEATFEQAKKEPACDETAKAAGLRL
jgi:hypothetical protein